MVFTVALWRSPAVFAMANGTSAVPVAVKVTGLPLSPADDACTVFVPAAVPSFQLPTAAMPSALVVGVAPVTLPPPVTLPKLTAIELTARPTT